nr:hypothetical protein [Tanacetum cinerariifolium]
MLATRGSGKVTTMEARANKTKGIRPSATAKIQRTRTCYECGSLRHYKTMTTVNQGTSVEEIERVVAQRVDNAIEAIAIYETKTNLACKVRASKPKRMQDAIKTTTKLMNKKISTLVECQTENKKRLDNTSKNNQNQQQPNKRQNTGRAYTARHGEKKHYSGSKPLCSTP